ncbi:TetR/AcrR family transcriptional regulator [Streptomyces sp. NPDC048172]|uniref:TetR/AcrR family transcriptional regulator n=1 Tax=Streptomyces sp. NPDC048172 TaxID=3365505 RepID=UPI00372408E9
MDARTSGRPEEQPGEQSGEQPSECSHVLAVADALFYAHGIQAVGMDRIRDAAGVSLKRLYRCFPSKAELVEAYLRGRDEWAHERLAAYLAEIGPPRERILGIFDWLHTWAQDPDFNGCAFLNAYGELASGSEGVVRAVRDHKSALRGQLLHLTEATGAADPRALAAQLALLLDGALSGAHVSGSAAPALDARAVAATLLDASGAAHPAPA